MRKILSSLLVIVSVASVAFAQKAPTSTKSLDRWEVYAGYDFDRSFGDYNWYNASESNKYNTFSPFNLNGGQASVAYFPWKHVGFKTAFTYSSKSAAIPGEGTENLTIIERSYLIGPVVRWTVPGLLKNRVTVFGQQLIGATHETMKDVYEGYEECNAHNEACRASGVTEVSGGGVDIRINRFVSVRPLELDYWNHQINQARFWGYNDYDWSGEYNYNVGANGFRYSTGISVHF